MVTLRNLLSLFAAALIAAVPSAGAQDYPRKPVRILTQPAGGGADFASRLIAPGLSAALGQQTVVDNRPGALPIEAAAKAPADGYTLLLFSNGMWLQQYMRDSVSWDAGKDFAPVTLVTFAPNILVVHPSLRVRSVRDLVALATARPGDLNFASAGTASMNQLAAELFNSMARVRMVHVPYKGGAPALNAVIGGQVHLMFAAAAPSLPHVRSGRLQALAVTGAQPSPLYSGLPTVAQTLPGYEATLMLGMFAPAKTPESVINRLNQALTQILKSADIREKFFNSGSEVAGTSPAELTAAIKTDMARWGKVILEAGIRDE